MRAGLVVEDVYAGYGKASVLDGVSLSVGSAERVIVLGPNGSGKSTVAKTLMSLTTLYRGEIAWNGNSISSTPAWQRVRMGLGYVPQVENVFRTLSVEENMLVGWSPYNRAQVSERLADLYNLFPVLAARRRVPAGNLSGGERRMLALATTLIGDPKLLILDEPTSDLAPAAIDVVFEKIQEICAEFNLPLLMIEQNVERAIELADRVLVLVRGRIVLERSAADVDEDEIGAVFLGHAETVAGSGGGS